MSRIRQREMPRRCPAAFLAGIILPHHTVLYSKFVSFRFTLWSSPYFAGCFVGTYP
jgi:hypothetical protein